MSVALSGTFVTTVAITGTFVTTAALSGTIDEYYPGTIWDFSYPYSSQYLWYLA